TVSGTYIDTLQSAIGCDSIVTTYLTVNPKPVPDLGRDKNLCSNTRLMVTPGSYTSYLWQDMSSANKFLIETPGKYWVAVTNNFGCTATDTINIPAVLTPPSNFLKETDSICNYGKLVVSSINAYATYKWSTGHTGQVAQVQQPGIYWLQVTDANGCSGRDSITILEKQCLSGIYFPNAFTPDKSGKNDVFKPVVERKLKQYRFTVYNRWGAAVFQTTDPVKGWDGNVGVGVQSIGLFVWTCSYQFEDGEPKLERGTVMIIR
ncbi:MAG TPA: gliding motility-associated C-terminal domain-containing protein, partial [Flavitalea sp.]|nr:gliding motility-associated C-terminal domain-containing protein [Flavitalea sp.]